jgi:two-component system sensor histidine kinase AlgZ
LAIYERVNLLSELTSKTTTVAQSDSIGMEDGFFLPDLCNTQSILFLVLIAELLVFVLVLMDSGIMNFGWAELGLTSLFVQWLALSSAVILCQLRRFLGTISVPLATSMAYSIVLILTLVLSLFAIWIMAGQEFQWQRANWDLVIRNLVISSIITGLIFRYLYLQQQFTRQKHAELRARIQALQSRIRPHFLFNSMNIIASLVSVDPDLAEDVVEDLSALFRASLSDIDTGQVTLAEELDLCRRYIRIETLRLDDRLRVDWKIEVDPSTVNIPLLTLQPLLENAIYHGIQPLPAGGLVTVRVTETNGFLTIRVQNPLGNHNNQHSTGNKMALENIHSRLQAIYGDKASLESTEASETFEIRLSYPLSR